MKHLKAFPNDPLENVIRNVFDFDVYKPETIEILADILDHHGYAYRSFYILFLIWLPTRLVVKNLGLDAAREATQKKVLDMAADRGAFICQSQSLNVHLQAPTTGQLVSICFPDTDRTLATYVESIIYRLVCISMVGRKV